MHLHGNAASNKTKPRGYPGTAHSKKWTQSDLTFCKNEGSKKLKVMEKGVNWIENEGKLIQNASNLLNNTFW